MTDVASLLATSQSFEGYGGQCSICIEQGLLDLQIISFASEELLEPVASSVKSKVLMVDNTYIVGHDNFGLCRAVFLSYLKDETEKSV